MRKFFQYLRTDTFRKNLIGAIIGITVFVVAIFFALQHYTRHGKTLPVPELRNMHISEAIRTLEALGFQYDLDSIYQMDKTPGLVLEQDPAPGTQVKENRTLYLTMITQMAPEVSFPDLIEKTFIEARAMLSSYGLRLGDTTYTADIARDVVLDATFGGQTLSPGRPIPKGSTIDLVLGDGRGANQVEVPDLNGLTISEVRFSLSGLSLTLGSVSYSGTVVDTAQAVVISQSPLPTDPFISIGSPVNITLSNE